jgi:hypothetical protein
MGFSKLNYPEGSLLFDVRYHRKPECFEVVYWSPITNRLEVQYEDPIIDLWFLKEDERTNQYQISQAEIDKCYPVYCKPSQIPKVIANTIGGEWLNKYNAGKDAYAIYDLKKEMCKCPWVFKGDFTPDVYFRLRWLNQFGDQCDVSKVSFALLDIEVDVLDRVLDPKDYTSAPQPINAVTLLLPEQKICAVFVLAPRPKEKLHPKFHQLLDKQVEDFNWLTNHQKEFIEQIRNYDEDNKTYISDYDIRLHIFDFNDEIYMIKTIFDYINKYRPMFCMSWNAPFDDNYLMNRCSYLGYDPRDIIIPKEFKTDMLYFSEDKSSVKTIKSSKHFFFSSTYTVFLCQMRNFAAIRKSQQERRSYSLSSVGKDMAKIDKLTQTKSGSFREFAYTDFLKFILYNVRDVVVQYAIELACCDCQSLVGRSYMFATQYAKCFQETHIVRDIREYFFENEGYVQSNRLIVDPNIDTAFKGAFVAPTIHNAPTGQILNGKKINNIMYGVLDADAASYYPSTKMAMNMDPMSLLYKCLVDNTVFRNGQCTNHSFNQVYYWNDSKNKQHPEDMTGPIINSYKNGNIFSLVYNWFNLKSVSDYFETLDSILGYKQ